MDLLQKLKEQGWYLTEDGIKKISENVENIDVKKAIQAAMDMDFKEIAGGALKQDLSKKDDSIPGNVVLQITRIRNISAPKANEESKVAPRFLQIELTDGINQIVGLEFEHISALNLNIPPGTKVYLKNNSISYMQNFLILRPNDIQLLGGKVSALIEKWEISRTLQKYARGGIRMTGTSGPPPWIPFGQKIQQNFGNDKNFKSLNADKDKEGKENNEFEVMRSEAIAEAAKAGGKKVFGGGNQQIVDHNVKKIMEKGYTEDEAKNALKTTRNNLERALYNLKRRDNVKIKEDPRDKSKRGGLKDLKKSKDDLVVSTKPAGNVSLFDFLTDKLPIPSEVNEKSTSRPDRNSKSSSEPPKSSVHNANNQSNYNQSQHHHNQHHQHHNQQQHHQTSTSRENHYQSQQQHQQNSSIPNQMNNKPKFENNMSASFAIRNSSGAIIDNDKGRSGGGSGSNTNIFRNSRGGGGGGGNSSTNTYQNRQNDNSDKYRDNHQRNAGNNYNSRNQKPPVHESRVTNNYQNGPSISGSSYESRNRNDYQQKNGYDKYGKGSTTSTRYQPKGDSNTYQSNNRNYHENRSTTYNNDSLKINKLTEETTKLKIDSNRSSRPSGGLSSAIPPTSRGQQNISIQQYHHQQQQQPQQHQKSIQQQQQTQHTLQSQQQQQQQQKPSHTISHGTFAQLPNGFAYDPSKIIGFQNKETNEFAMTLLKNQAAIAAAAAATTTIATQSPSVASHPQYAVPPSAAAMQITQAPPPPFPGASFVMQQPPNPHPQPPTAAAAFGINPGGESWNWKVGDRCLAKYWDDGRYYEAEITGISDKTFVVFYLGYGNHEEVLKSDCLPITDVQNRPINFTKMHEIHSQAAVIGQQQQQQQQQGIGQQPPNMNRNLSTRYRGERQMYVPPPKRDV